MGLRFCGVLIRLPDNVFLKADGVTTTLEQNPDDLVYLGDSQPKINSTFNTSFYMEGIECNCWIREETGGKQINYTELNKGENVSLSSNLDRRLFKIWLEHISGDQARYKNQWGTTSRGYCDEGL